MKKKLAGGCLRVFYGHENVVSRNKPYLLVYRLIECLFRVKW